MLKLFSKITNNGIHAKLSQNEISRLKVFNAAVFIIFLISIFYSFVSIMGKIYMATALTTFSFVCCIIAMYLIYKRIYFFTYIFVINYGILFLLGFSVLFGLSQKTYLYFMFMPVAANIMFDNKKTVLLYSIISTICLAFLLNVFDVYFKPVYYAESLKISSAFAYTNTFFASLLIYLGIKTFKSEGLKYQRKIEEQKGILEEKQKEILDSIQYAKRIQQTLLPSEKSIQKSLNKLKKNSKVESS